MYSHHPLHVALESNQIKKVLHAFEGYNTVNLEERNTKGFTLLQLSVLLGKIEVVLTLINAGADVNNALPMEEEKANEAYSIEARKTPLFLAVENGHIYLAKILLIAGASLERALENANYYNASLVDTLNNLPLDYDTKRFALFWCINHHLAYYPNVLLQRILADNTPDPARDEEKQAANFADDMRGLIEYTASESRQRLHPCLLPLVMKGPLKYHPVLPTAGFWLVVNDIPESNLVLRTNEDIALTLQQLNEYNYCERFETLYKKYSTSHPKAVELYQKRLYESNAGEVISGLYKILSWGNHKTFENKNIKEIFKAAVRALEHQNYVALNAILMLSVEKELLIEAFAQNNMTLAVFLFLNTNVTPYQLALKLQEDKQALKLLTTHFVGPESLISTMVHQHRVSVSLLNSAEAKFLQKLQETHSACLISHLIQSVQTEFPNSKELKMLAQRQYGDFNSRLQDIQLPQNNQLALIKQFRNFRVNIKSWNALLQNYAKQYVPNELQSLPDDFIRANLLPFFNQEDLSRVALVSYRFNALAQPKLAHRLKAQMQMINDFLDSAERDLQEYSLWQILKDISQYSRGFRNALFCLFIGLPVIIADGFIHNKPAQIGLGVGGALFTCCGGLCAWFYGEDLMHRNHLLDLPLNRLSAYTVGLAKKMFDTFKEDRNDFKLMDCNSSIASVMDSAELLVLSLEKELRETEVVISNPSPKNKIAEQDEEKPLEISIR